MQDQLVIFQALTEGSSRVETGQLKPTLHTQTAKWVTERMLGISFLSEEREGEEGEGLALQPGVFLQTCTDKTLKGLEESTEQLELVGDSNVS